MELDRKEFLKLVVIFGGAELLGCGTTGDSGGTGGGSSGTGGGTSGAGGGTSAAGGGTSAAGGGTSAAGGGTSAAGGGTSAAGGGTSAAGGGTSGAGGGTAHAGGGTSGAGGGSTSNACTADIHADSETALGATSGIASMHEHHLVVLLTDLEAGVDVTYTHGVKGAATAGHTHSFALTAAEIATLKSGASITKSTENITSGSGTPDATTHSHMVKLIC